MTLFYDINTIVSTGAEAIFKLKGVLTASGWTVCSSSDATTVNSSCVDQITSSGAGAGGMTNNSAWFVIQEPGISSGSVGRAWCFQRGTTNVLWRIKVSPLAGFITGSAAATRSPAAVDETVLWGAGTDAVPTYATFFTTDGIYRWHVIADNTAIGATGNTAYGFWAFDTTTGTGLNRTLIGQDPVMSGTCSPLVGTRTSPTLGDADPVFYMVGWNTTANNVSIANAGMLFNSTNDTKAGHAISYMYRYNLSGQALTMTWANELCGSQSSLPKVYGTDPTTSYDSFAPYIVARGPYIGYGGGGISVATNVGVKGIMNYMRKPLMARAYPDTMTIGSEARVYLNDLLLPWPSGSVPAL
jgi:hypothetical protein